jgi:MFS family permease
MQSSSEKSTINEDYSVDHERSEKTALPSSPQPAIPPDPSPHERPAEVDDSPPPDGGYGWVCCLAVTGINGFIWGNLASYGVYLSYYLTNSARYGGTAIAYAFIGGANFAAAMLIAPLTNLLIRRYGTKFPMYLGILLWLAGWIAASYSHNYWQLFLSQGILVGLGAGLNWLPAAPILPQWFSRKRSLAQGLASSGSGTIGVIYAVATTPMIENLGLGWSLRITGITSTAVLVACTWVLKDRNVSTKADVRPFDVRLLRDKGVWLLSGYTFFGTLGYMVVISSFSAFAGKFRIPLVAKDMCMRLSASDADCLPLLREHTQIASLLSSRFRPSAHN